MALQRGHFFFAAESCFVGSGNGAGLRDVVRRSEPIGPQIRVPDADEIELAQGVQVACLCQVLDSVHQSIDLLHGHAFGGRPEFRRI